MTTEELRQVTLKSEKAEWYKGVNLKFSFPAIKFDRTITGYVQVYEFISQQAAGWDKLGKVPKELEPSKQFFSSIKTQMIELPEKKGWGITIEGSWDDINSFVRKKAKATFTYDSPEAEFLIRISEENPATTNGSFIYFTNNIDSYSLDSKDRLDGMLAAALFRNKQWNSPENNPVSHINITEKIEKFEEFYSRTDTQVTEFLVRINQNMTEQSETFEKLKTEKRGAFDNWFAQSKNTTNEFHTESKKKRKELEDTYQNLIRLKKPVEYWTQRADKLRKEGIKFRNILLLLVGIAAASLFLLLWLTPQGMLESLFSGDKSSAIRWSIVFVAFISVLFLGIKYISRVMFSSFHLARDAEEREQLTHVYLALIKDASVDEKDRHMIMQALFSRADTGLLKEDSSPTMPGNLGNIVSGK